MKRRLFLSLSLALIVVCGSLKHSHAQDTDSVYIQKFVDEMADESYLITSIRLVVANESQTKGFVIDAFLSEDFTLRTVYVKMVGLGSCNEEDEIIIQLDDGEKITKTSWKSFNCEGEAYFTLSKSDIEKLKSSPLNKIRMTNGRTFESYTGDVAQEQKRWFIQLFYSLENKSFVVITE